MELRIGRDVLKTQAIANPSEMRSRMRIQKEGENGSNTAPTVAMSIPSKNIFFRPTKSEMRAIGTKKITEEKRQAVDTQPRA